MAAYSLAASVPGGKDRGSDREPKRTGGTQREHGAHPPPSLAMGAHALLPGPQEEIGGTSQVSQENRVPET
jgi:hypothetical protein